jgi:hypothetical protein
MSRRLVETACFAEHAQTVCGWAEAGIPTLQR